MWGFGEGQIYAASPLWAKKLFPQLEPMTNGSYVGYNTVWPFLTSYLYLCKQKIFV